MNRNCVAWLISIPVGIHKQYVVRWPTISYERFLLYFLLRIEKGRILMDFFFSAGKLFSTDKQEDVMRFSGQGMGE